MADPNLTGALKASLASMDTFAENSPLAEDVGKNAVDEFLDRINEDLVAGAVDRITDERLAQLINIYRADALRWEQEQQTKEPRKRKSMAEAVKIDY